MCAVPSAGAQTAVSGAASSDTPISSDNRRTPIISDEEFDSSIPPIDDNPDAPIGSVRQWDAEQQRLQRQANGNGSATPAPTAQDRANLDIVADPTANDAEIDASLTPLNQFDVTPIDASAYTEAADDAKPASLRYTYRIDGLSGLDDDSAVEPVDAGDIEGRFKDLSTLEDGDGKAANGAMVSARMREDQQLLADILQGQGYFDATVNGSVQLPPKEGGAVAVILSVVPGRRYAFGAITFDTQPLTPADLVSSNFKIARGEPIVAERVQAGEANIAVELPQNGYPFAKVGDRDILLDPQTGTGDYTLPINAGPRSSFGTIVTSGTTVFDARHIGVLARFRRGELYDSTKVDDLRQALVATGLFSLVSITPEPTGEPGPDGTEYARLLVQQQAGPPRTLAAEAGYGTGQGFRVEGSWTHRNLFPPEGALILGAVAGTQEQSASARFRRSNAGRRDRSVELGIAASHSDYDAYEAYTGLISGKIAYSSTPIWQKKLTYNYGFELLASNEQDYDFAAGRLNRRTFYVAALPGQVTFDRSDSLLDPTSGTKLTATLSPEASLGAGTQVYARAQLEGTAYYPVNAGLVLAGRVRVGSITGADREQIAPSRRYYAGGGGSVRGFGFQELGPKDPRNRPIGGRSLIETAAEVRYRFGNYGVVGFVDAGQVYTSSMPRFDDIRFGVGLGARLYTNFGPMRLDVATPIGRKAGESRVAVYVSIGQAF